MLDSQLFYILCVYSVILIIAILLGGQLPHWLTLTHKRMQLVMSFVSGLMLGIAIFHLLPHAIYAIDAANAVDIVARWTMAGLLTMFLLLRVSHFHHHDIADDAHDVKCVERSEGALHHHGTDKGAAQFAGWLGIALGLTIHTIIDGVALAASMQADFLLLDSSAGAFSFVGLGVFIAILLHKPLDALTISSMMSRGGLGNNQQRLVLLSFALICPISASLMLWGFDFVAHANGVFIGSAQAFSAGVFLCISLSDLLPEVHFHSHDRLSMTLALLLGIGFSLVLINFEPDHRHTSVANQAHIHHHVEQE